MAGWLLENARTVLDPAAFGIVGAEINPPDLRQRDRRRTHRAWLQRHVEVAAGQPLHPESGGAGAQRQHLGMRRRVAILLDLVAERRNDRAALVDQRRPDRNLAALRGRLCLCQSERHSFWGGGGRAGHRLHRRLPVGWAWPMSCPRMKDSLPQPAAGLTRDSEPPQRIAKVLARAGLC